MPWTEPLAQEFRHLVGLGMPPMDAIQSATSRAADMLEMKGEIGVIAPGAFADIVAVKGDPLKDVTELEHVRFVMHDGSIFKNELANKKSRTSRPLDHNLFPIHQQSWRSFTLRRAHPSKTRFCP